MVGQGCPDILIGHLGTNVLIEIKDGDTWKSHRKLTKDEKEWHEAWRGQVVIIETDSEAIKLVEEIKMNKQREYKQKFKGRWIDKECPKCGGQMIGTHTGDEWCGNMKCGYGLDDFKDNVDVVKK